MAEPPQACGCYILLLFCFGVDYLGKLDDLAAAEQSRQPPQPLRCDVAAFGDLPAQLKKTLRPIFAFFRRASAVWGSSAYRRTPSPAAVMTASSGTMWPTWQFEQYQPPISSAGATTPAHAEVAAPWGTVFN